MSDQKEKIRVLILDDSGAGLFRTDQISFALRMQHGLDSDWVAVSRSDFALDIIYEWAKQGHRVDILTVDICGGYRDYPGIQDLEEIVAEIREKLGEEFVPKHMFLHSADRLPNTMKTALGPIPTLEGVELHAIGSDMTNWEGKYRTDEFCYRSSNLRKFLNETYGTDFPLSISEAKLRNDPAYALSEIDVEHLVRDGVMDTEEALLRVQVGDKYSGSGHAEIDFETKTRSCSVEFEDGVEGAACGRAAFNAEDVKFIQDNHPGDDIILVVKEFEPEHAELLEKCQGIIVLTDKMTGHCRQLCENYGIPAAFNCSDEYKTENDALLISPDEPAIKQGDYIAFDTNLYFYTHFGAGSDDDVAESSQLKGKLYPGKHKIRSTSSYYYDSDDGIHLWAENARKKYNGLGIYANADTVEQVESAIQRGADGISLVRTEHAFLSEERREVLKAALLDQEKSAFDMIRHYHVEDFTAMFSAAKDSGREFSVRIRLLDAPPGEFLNAEERKKFEDRVGSDNLRGVQAGLKTPGLYESQIAAVFEASQRTGFTNFEICVPTIRTPEEMHAVKSMVRVHGNCTFGVMIETLPAAENAGELAKHCDFLNIGCNDLTSEIMGGIARNDFQAIQKWQIDHNVQGRSPFISFSSALEEKVIAVVQTAKAANPAVKICLCGSQAAGGIDHVDKVTSLGLNSISVPASSVHNMRLLAGKTAIHRAQKSGGMILQKPFVARKPPESLF